MYSNVVIYTSEGNSRILGIKSNDDIKLPMGRIKPGEEPIDAVVRVLKQQTGLGISERKSSLVYHTYHNGELLLVYYIDGYVLKGEQHEDLDGTIGWYSTSAFNRGPFAGLNTKIINNV